MNLEKEMCSFFTVLIGSRTEDTVVQSGKLRGSLW